MLSKFVSQAFRSLFEVILWIILIGCAAAGCIIGHKATGYEDTMHAIIGLAIGLVAGMIVNVVWGGIIATFLNIDLNLQKMIGANVNGNWEEGLVTQMLNVNTSIEKSVLKTGKLVKSMAEQQGVADFDVQAQKNGQER